MQLTTDTAGTPEQTQPDAPVEEPAVEAPETAENAPEVTPEPEKQETPPVKEVDWESRLKDIQARATRAEQDRAEERKARRDLEARLAASEKYFESIWTDEDKEAYAAEVQSRTRAAAEQDIHETRLQTLSGQIGAEVKEIADEVLALGILADTSNLKAALLVGNAGQALAALTEAVPDLYVGMDMPSAEELQKMPLKEQADVVEKGLERLRASARKELPKLHVNAVSKSFDSRLKKLEEALAAKDKEMEEKAAAHAAELAEARAVSTSTGGGAGNVTLEEIQARHKGDPYGMLDDPDYKRLRNRK